MENKGLSLSDHQELLGWLEENLRHGNFELVDDYLARDNPERLTEVGMLIVLTITFHGKEHLANRNIFLEKVEPLLKARLGVERAENLLKNRR